MRRRFLLLFTMLIISALVATGAGYAWFNVATFASYQSSLIQASASGNLRIYASTANQNEYPRIFENYADLIDFSDVSDPFYSNDVIDHGMGDQSGDGMTFYQLNKRTRDSYKTISGIGRALTLDMWFSAYNGLEDDNYTKAVFLTEESIVSVDKEISSAIRVAFIKNSAVLGIWAPNANHEALTYVTTDDYLNETLIPSGAIKDNPENGEIKLIRSGHHAIATTIFTIDASSFDEEGVDNLRLVIWFEGTDENCIDDYLGQDVDINLVFAVRNALS